MERLGLERAGEFLEMAATLIRIKAQLLFPRHEEDEEEDPRAELVRRLLEYEHFREAAELLAAAERERSRFRAEGIRGSPPGPAPGRRAAGDRVGRVVERGAASWWRGWRSRSPPSRCAAGR